VRLADEACTPADRAAFEAWRTASPEHEAVFERESVAWERLDRLRALRRAEGWPDPDLLAPETHDVRTPDPALIPRAPEHLTIAPELPTFGSQTISAPPRRRSRWAAVAAGLVVFLGTAASLVLTVIASPAYATGIGERRVVVLTDGSRIELNTNSKVVVRYRENRREVELIRGEALFDVAKDARPFVIRASDMRLQAGSSELAVRLKSGGATVTVREGSVAMEEPQSENASGSVKGVVLTPGTESFYGPSGASVHEVSSEEIDRLLAWRRGGLALNGAPLSQAVEEFNRYNTQQVVIADPSIAGLRLAGYFQTSDLGGFVTALTNTFPIEARGSSDGSIYLSRKPSGHF
jgi:transmembrane sensor